MIKNYLTLTLRQLKRRPGYSLINISGFTVGLACCLLIILYVVDELRFDRFHEKTDRIYRIVEKREDPRAGTRHVAYTMAPLGPTLANDLADVDQYARLFAGWRLTLQEGDEGIIMRSYYFADPSLFDLFDYETLHGNPKSALSQPNGVVLTAATAHRLFGSVNVVGRPLEVEAEDFPEFAEGGFQVGAVIEDLPHNTHLSFEMLISIATLDRFDFMAEALQSWQNAGFMTTYVLAREGVRASDLDEGLREAVQAHRGAEDWEALSLYAQPLTDIHFFSDHIQAEENRQEGNLTYNYMLALIALVIVLIACFNYMNLATARSARRAREVGLRKVVGARLAQLVRQFLTESVIMTLLSMFAAVLLIWIVLPAFNTLVGKDLELASLLQPGIVAGMLLLVLLVGIFSGSYPAFYLTRFLPVEVLKNAFRPGASRLRHVLVVSQFSLSIGLIVGAMTIGDQLDFLRQKQLGFDQSQLVVVDINNDNIQSNFQAVKAELMRDASIQGVTVSSRVPGDWKSFRRIGVATEETAEGELPQAYFNAVDPDFLNTYDMQLVGGRNFDRDFASDSTSLLINEAAAKALFDGSPVGEMLQVPDYEFTGRVIGVVQDFHFHSLHSRIEPIVLGRIPDGGRHVIHGIDYFTLKVSSEQSERAIEHLKTVHERFDPVNPTEYAFLNEWIDSKYRQVERVGRIFGIASVLAIVIAIVGLVGLAGYMTERRTKEIGIRKVLGADVSGLIWLLSTDFMKLVGIAFVIASPLAYFALRGWLDEFAYHTTMSFDLYLLAGVLAAAAAFLTVSGFAVKTALTNPIQSLRSE